MQVLLLLNPWACGLVPLRGSANQPSKACIVVLEDRVAGKPEDSIGLAPTWLSEYRGCSCPRLAALITSRNATRSVENNGARRFLHGVGRPMQLVDRGGKRSTSVKHFAQINAPSCHSHHTLRGDKAKNSYTRFVPKSSVSAVCAYSSLHVCMAPTPWVHQ